MNFLDKLERKFGKFAIPNLMLYILMGHTLVFLLTLFGSSLISYLYFDIYQILRGQIWRIVTFVFIPNTFEPVFFIFAVLLYYSIGRELEATWGTFKFNLYYLIGMIFCMLGTGIIQLSHGPGYVDATYYLNLSLFLAFATLYPNLEFLLFMIIPVKAKYLAYLDGALIAYSFIMGGLASKVLIALSLLNFFLFFGAYLLKGRGTPVQRNFKKQKRELKKGDPIHVAFHKCTVCGKTELTDPDMEFRYCSKCNGNHEYCMDHLHNHEHIK